MLKLLFSYSGFSFVRFEGNSILPKSPKLDFFRWNSIFSPWNSISGNFEQILHFKMLFEIKICMGWPFLLHYYYQNSREKGNIYIFSIKLQGTLKKRKETAFQKGWNSFSKCRNSFSKRRNSLVPHFVCKDWDGFRTKKKPVVVGTQ